jgi:chemotaxis signal transduction protein
VLETKQQRDVDIPSRLPSLEMLIDDIDRRIDQLPSQRDGSQREAYWVNQPKDLNRHSRQYIQFSVNGYTFAVPIENTAEIEYTPEITTLPNLPEWILGICSLRGDIVSVVDFALKFELGSRKNSNAGKLILLHHTCIRTAVLADQVAGMWLADDLDKRDPISNCRNAVLAPVVADMISKNGHPVHLLDVAALITALAL